MKIWYISKYANVPTSEGATRHFMLSKSMANYGHDITLIYSRSNGFKHLRSFMLFNKQLFDDVKCIMINGPVINLGFNIKRLLSWIGFEVKLLFFSITRKSKKRPDVVIVSSLSLITFISGIILKKIFKSKLILEVRDIWPDSVIQIGKISEHGIIAKVLRWIEKQGYKNADGIIATMPRFDLYLFERYGIRTNFKCIPQGYDKTWINSFDDFIESPFNEKFFNVCYAGTIGRANYVEHLLQAAILLKDTNIRFYILGNGEMKNKLQEEFFNFSNIIFIDAIPKEYVVKFISRADLLVHMCSKHKMYKYGISPYKWIDYMLSGVPILVSYDGYQSIINEANCGFFIEAENIDILAKSIYNISNMDKEQLIKFGQNGKSYVYKHHDYNYLGQELLNFIEKC